MEINYSAIHEDEIEGLFKRLNLYDALINGEIKCSITCEVIDHDNFGGIQKVDGQLQIYTRKGLMLLSASKVDCNYLEEQEK